MLKKHGLGLFLFLFSALTFGQSSEKVLAIWSDGWYVGTVVQKIGDKYKVVYDDGGEALLHQPGIRPVDWGVGSRVQCNFQGKGYYYWGRIMQKSGERISIDYEDGAKEVTLIGRCRVPH